jgi:ribose/xylose/arabinose/galactoside ABC-type transport system permease subunit
VDWIETLGGMTALRIVIPMVVMVLLVTLVWWLYRHMRRGR